MISHCFFNLACDPINWEKNTVGGKSTVFLMSEGMRGDWKKGSHPSC